ncbi:hypothetical protein SAMN05428949_1237 [Chitinophaga sp. YR627]|uniref:hypothetical protein n=1 Tax=Chitinophaga sp. YR627 TaxID=1881041 RepID=UPI0008ECFFBF|nr:hypothetical protein [Chitinophaga sp. YR627]SFM90451.1 hypothetical protein SAMN05428949_1237 [Chitinophaga sp. YR627]
MRITTIDHKGLKETACNIPPNIPVVMLNLLRFKSDGGREIYYQQYIPAFRELTAKLQLEGIKLTWGGNVSGRLAIADNECWDDVLLVEYPDFASFLLIAESDGYRNDAEPFRLAAIDDCRLIPMVGFMKE